MKIYTIDELAKGRGPDKQKRKSRGVGQTGVENPEYHPIERVRVIGPPLGDPFPSKNSLGWRSWIKRNQKWINENPKWNPPSGTGLLRTGAVKNMPGHYFNKSDLDELAKGRGPDLQQRKKRGKGLEWRGEASEWGTLRHQSASGPKFRFIKDRKTGKTIKQLVGTDYTGSRFITKGRGPDIQPRKKRSLWGTIKKVGKKVNAWATEGVKEQQRLLNTKSGGPAPNYGRYGSSFTRAASVLTIDELHKAKEEPFEKGRGPDKQKRRRRGTGSFANDTALMPWVIGGEVLRRKGLDSESNKKFISDFSRKLKGLYRDNPKIRKLLSGEGNEGRDYAYKLAEKMSENMEKSDLELTPQDEKNIDLIRAMVDKNPDLQKKLEGPIKWVGAEGFDTCVAHLSKKKGITNAKALCGYLKDEARHKGELSPTHMGRLEKKAYKAKKGNTK